MRSIEPIASRIPYMSIPGNHEFYFNFTQYRNRFSMPNSVENLFYSFDLGDAHIIGITTEIYYSLYLNKNEQLQRQYNWLVEDLRVSIIFYVKKFFFLRKQMKIVKMFLGSLLWVIVLCIALEAVIY